MRLSCTRPKAQASSGGRGWEGWSGGVGGIMGQHGAAFAGGELLVGIEAEDGEVAEAACAAEIGLVSKLGTDGLAGVFNEDQVVAAGDGLKSVHFRGEAEGVDDEDGAGAGRDGPLDAGGREVEGDGVDLRKDGRGADLEDRVGYCNECERGNDDLVAFADAEGEQSEMKAGGAGADE